MCCTLFLSFHSFGQAYNSYDYRSYDPNTTTEPKVKFGLVDATSMTIEQILGNPRLTCKDAGCEVLSYELRVTRRSQDFFGPYEIKGTELTESVKHLIKNMDVMKGKLYFENIRVKYNGKEMILSNDYVLRSSYSLI